MQSNFLKTITMALLGLGLGLWLTACTQKSGTEKQKSETTYQRIISLDGGITEIVAALGFEHQLVGRDVTSVYPDWVRDSVKELGMVSSITIEGLMAQKPDLILGVEDAVSDDLKQKLKESGLTYHLFKKENSIAGSKKLIGQIAELLKSDKAVDLDQKIDRDLAQLDSFVEKPKVLFIYARGAGTLLVAGDSTQMSDMIAIAGGQNAVTEFSDFKPLTPEALLKNDPDIILLFDSGMQSLNGIDGLLKVPGIAETKAGKNKAIITMSGSLVSSFGPRVGEAAAELNQKMSQYVR